MRFSTDSFSSLLATTALLLLAPACGSSSSPSPSDGGDVVVTKHDAHATDSGKDAGHSDAGHDTGTTQEAGKPDALADAPPPSDAHSPVDTGSDAGGVDAATHDSGGTKHDAAKHDSGGGSTDGGVDLDAGNPPANCMGSFDCNAFASNVCIVAACTSNMGSGTCAYSYAASGTPCTGGTCDGEGHCK